MATQTSAPAIITRGLTKDFGDMRAVDRVDLHVPRGEIFGVLGPNGAGKTTMLRMLATLEPITGGTAQVHGFDVARQPHRVRRLIGVTGQYAAVDNGLTARENLTLFGRLHGLPRARMRGLAHELLEEFSLTEAGDRKVEKFSGGMRRRLDLAISLISSPPLIFLDEPTTGLDPRTRNHMWGKVRDLAAQGHTVLLTTQYLEEADQLADRIAVIDHGRLVALGSPQELKTRVGGYRLRVHVEDPAGSAAARDELHRLVPERNVQSMRGEISCPLTHTGEAAGLISALHRTGIPLSGITVSEPSLDEVFFALTGEDAAEPALQVNSYQEAIA